MEINSVTVFVATINADILQREVYDFISLEKLLS